jgi:uncharacterized protein HemY
MLEFSTVAFLLIPASLAVAFLLWVLWNFLKQDPEIASWIAVRRRKADAGSRRSNLRGMPSGQPFLPKA